MKYFSLLIVLSGIMISQLSAQTERITEYNIVSSMFRIDNLGYLYFVNGNTLTKMDGDFKTVAIYDNKKNGAISDIDVSDPFRVLVFYRDFNKLIFLDNELTELRDPILLDDLQIYNVDAVCSSTQGSFKLFDSQNCFIVSFDKDLNVLQTGINLYSLVKTQKVQKIRESNNYTYAQFDDGIFITLDKFGNFFRKSKFENLKSFNLLNDRLFLLTDTGIYKCGYDDSLIEIVNSADIKIVDFAVRNNFLYVLSEKSLITFIIL